MLKKALSCIISLLMVLNITIPVHAAPVQENRVLENKDQITKADVVFVIDSTGSMSNSIHNIKSNISTFVQYLDSLNIDLRMAIVEYKDITVDGNNSTIVHQINHSPWHYTSDDFIKTLNKINVNGGGDSPETIIDGYGKVLDEDTMLFRSDANKFVISLTDASLKIIIIMVIRIWMM